MSDDMGIPDDVIERADSAWRDRMREPGYTEDANSAITAARHAEYQVIAEWAREVALEDAAQINAIRALRSGTADTNPKEDDRG